MEPFHLLQLVTGRSFSLAGDASLFSRAGEDCWRSTSTNTTACSLASETGNGDIVVANAPTFIADTASILLQPLKPTLPAVRVKKGNSNTDE